MSVRTDNTGLAAPLAAPARVPAMDVLRGLALLGILLMNLEGMAGPPATMASGIDPSLHGLDRWVDAAIYVLVQGKFIALFSLLFGAGFAVMQARAEREGWALGPVWLRRCAGLLVIGLAHALLVWSGDILVTYALCGFALLAFGEVLGGLLAWIGVLLFLAPAGLSLAVGMAHPWLSGDPAWQQAVQAQTAHVQSLAAMQVQVYAHGGYLTAVAQRLRDFVQVLQALPLNGLQVFGLFLVGTWLHRVLARPADHRRALAWMRYGALPLGLAMMGLSVMLSPWLDPARTDPRLCLAAALASAAALPCCLGYIGWCMAGFAVRPTRLATWLAAAGRLALSNYLLQSLVCTWVFYGAGLGMFGMARRWQLPFAVGLFGMQLLASRWWARRGWPGPAEWLLRRLTYGAAGLRQAGWPARRADARKTP